MGKKKLILQEPLASQKILGAELKYCVAAVLFLFVNGRDWYTRNLEKIDSKPQVVLFWAL
jgi:hypothetical protein